MNTPLFRDQDEINQMRVRPDIGKINGYIQKSKHVALEAIAPLYGDAQNKDSLQGFDITIKGPSRYVSYFLRLLKQDNLIIG